jgi:hypothetical protein
MQRLNGRIVHYVYAAPRWKLVGRLVYNEYLPAPLTGEYLINAIDLGETFSAAEEFQRRIDAVRRESK